MEQKRVLADKIFDAYEKGDKRKVIDLFEVLFQYLEYEKAQQRRACAK